MAKRKPSPIRFESVSSTAVKKGAASIYSPPKDKFSKKFAGASSLDDFFEQKSGSRRGARGKRGRMKLKSSWRV